MVGWIFSKKKRIRLAAELLNRLDYINVCILENINSHKKVARSYVKSYVTDQI